MRNMKRIIALLFCLVPMLFSVNLMNVSAAESQLEGSGTKESPWLISDAEDFVLMSSLIESDASYADDYYQMTNDIDFTDVTMTSIGKTNHFSGVFDGQLYAVRNLTMSDTTENTGLFAFVEDGTIKNLGIENSTITGNKNVGALAGRTMRAVVINCYSKASVSGYNDVGGIVGMFNSSWMYNCYSAANVTATKSSNGCAGGLVGSANTSLDTANPVTIDNVYSVATVTCPKYAGSLVGYDGAYSGTYVVNITNAYYYGTLNASGNFAAREATLLTEAEMTDGTLFNELNANLKDGYQQWIEGIDNYPEFTATSLSVSFSGQGTEESPYLIDTAEDLIEMAIAVNASNAYATAHYKMTSSIDLKDVSFNGIASVKAFSGTFDGTGHVLKNVNIDHGGSDYTGVFYRISGGTVKNLGIESGMIEGGNYVGGIAGFAENATIMNCFNAATIKGYGYGGGLVGQLTNSHIYNSFNKGFISIVSRAIGGLVGKASAGSAGSSTIKNCYSIGDILIGNYCGQLFGYADKNVVLENVYYNKEAPIKNQPIGNFTGYTDLSGVTGLTAAEITDQTFAATLNANVQEGYMSWVYADDKIARLADFAEIAKVDIFMASIEEVTIKDSKVQTIVSEDGAYKTVVYGSNNKNVIDLEGNVYQPLTTQKVLLILDIVDTATGEVVDQVDRNIEVTIEGKYADSGVNKVPNVVPGLREWYGLEGNFAVTANTRIVVSDAAMSGLAVRIQEHMKKVIGIELEITTENSVSGDIVLKYTPERYNELQKEGYAIEIADQIVIEASTETAMFYGAVSIMQILHQDEAHTNVPKGYVRDYPQYELRGGMLDVGRRWFSLDYVKEIGLYMSWFKLNTLHLHINESGGEYSGAFIVESKKYPQLNSNNAEYVWSQDDYRQLQTDLRDYGIEVITEIDTPGHSTVFSTINSTIVDGTSLNLASYYDESLALIESVFDEFLDGDDPVFQNAVVHIGTDESSNSNEDMRRYISDLSQYVLAKDNVDKVIFWGNLALYYGQTEIDSENVIAQLWKGSDYRVDAALASGFEIINSNYNMLYLTVNNNAEFGPGAHVNGYVDLAKFYDTWKGASDFDTHNLSNPFRNLNKNDYSEHDLLKGNPKILGAIVCNWNDGIPGFEYDIAELLASCIAGVSEKCWYGDTDRFESGTEFAEAFNKVGNYAPYANPRYRVDSKTETIASYDFEEMIEGVAKDSENGYDAVVTNGSIVKADEERGNVLVLDGTTSVQLPFEGVGYPYTVTFDIYLNGAQNQDAVLFDCDECTIYLDYEGNGVSFKSGKYTYTFNAAIPTDEWVKISLTSKLTSYIRSSSNTSVLTINGLEYTPVALAKDCGSKTTILGTKKMFSGVVGSIDNFEITNVYTYDPLLDTYKYEGDGTEESPYLIQSSEDLRLFSKFMNAGIHQDAFFKLTTDIDMTDIPYKTAAEFNGTLDGDGHKITNLTISESLSTNVGLIGLLEDGTIKNLGIENSTITGKEKVGGLVGRSMRAVVINCYSKATVSGYNDVGGIVGMFNSSWMYNCYSAANVTATKSSNGCAGGLVGSANTSLDTANPVTIDNVYSVATVTCPKSAGMLVGYDGAYTGVYVVNITNAYYYGTLNASGNFAAREATLLSEAELTDGTLLNALTANLVDGYETWAEDAENYPCFSYQLDTGVLGDIDGDGRVSLADALKLIRSIAGGNTVKNGDVNGNGRVDLADVIRVLKLVIE